MQSPGPSSSVIQCLDTRPSLLPTAAAQGDRITLPHLPHLAMGNIAGILLVLSKRNERKLQQAYQMLS